MGIGETRDTIHTIFYLVVDCTGTINYDDGSSVNSYLKKKLLAILYKP